MALAGCTTIKIGVESASPELLVAIGRAENEAEARQYLTYVHQVVAAARRYGIHTRVFVMVGLPGQSQADVATTAAFLRTLRPTFVHVRPYEAYPRVPLGDSQPPGRTGQLLPPLQAIAAERQAAYRSPILPARLLRRIRLKLG